MGNRQRKGQMKLESNKSKVRHSLNLYEYEEVLLQQTYKKLDGIRSMSGFIGILVTIGLDSCRNLSDYEDFQRLFQGIGTKTGI
jgi:hypothetical protein